LKRKILNKVKDKMRILFVAMPDSIHTVRWISQITNQSWKIYLFPSYDAKIHSELNDVVAFGSVIQLLNCRKRGLRMFWWTLPFFFLDYVITRLKGKYSSRFASIALSIAVRLIRPDIVHSLEFQRAGYLTLESKMGNPSNFPCWVVSNWGSGVFLFSRLKAHQAKVKAILKYSDYYACECERDIELALELGFQGGVLPVLPISGGVNLRSKEKLKSNRPPSSRGTILLKGYQTWAGRALVGLQALRFCVDELQNYSLAISVCSSDVRIAAELFAQDTHLPVTIIPPVSHDEMLRIHGSARIYIGLSITDGISTSMLEAMVMGAFPIQSNTACANEWVQDGVSGIIVPPEDPHVIAEAIRIALTDDELVDSAAEINARKVKEKLDYSKIQPQVVNMYQEIFESLGDGS